MLYRLGTRGYSIFDDLDAFLNAKPYYTKAALPASKKQEDTLTVKDESDKWVVTGLFPGIDPEDVDVTIQGNVIDIKVEKDTETEEGEEGQPKVKRKRYVYERQSYKLDDVKTDDVSVTLKDGTLEVSLPKVDSLVRKKIDVQNG